MAFEIEGSIWRAILNIRDGYVYDIISDMEATDPYEMSTTADEILTVDVEDAIYVEVDSLKSDMDIVDLNFIADYESSVEKCLKLDLQVCSDMVRSLSNTGNLVDVIEDKPQDVPTQSWIAAWVCSWKWPENMTVLTGDSSDFEKEIKPPKESDPGFYREDDIEEIQ